MVLALDDNATHPSVSCITNYDAMVGVLAINFYFTALKYIWFYGQFWMFKPNAILMTLDIWLNESYVQIWEAGQNINRHI